MYMSSLYTASTGKSMMFKKQGLNVFLCLVLSFDSKIILAAKKLDAWFPSERECLAKLLAHSVLLIMVETLQKLNHEVVIIHALT